MFNIHYLNNQTAKFVLVIVFKQPTYRYYFINNKKDSGDKSSY